MKYLSFDIEISDEFELMPGEDLVKYAPFHISVAATVETCGNTRLWHSTESDGTPSVEMRTEDARELLSFLSDAQELGWQVFAWNGLGFDMQWIGHNAGDMQAAAKAALGMYDPMFQFFNQRGFPVGLASVGQAMGIQQAKLMNSADAPREWRKGNYQQVMDYVVGDCQITNQIVAAIAKRGCVMWRTKSGELCSEPMPRFKSLAEVLRDPEPDQSWMKGTGMRRRHFTGWMPKAALAACS